MLLSILNFHNSDIWLFFGWYKIRYELNDKILQFSQSGDIYCRYSHFLSLHCGHPQFGKPVYPCLHLLLLLSERSAHQKVTLGYKYMTSNIWRHHGTQCDKRITGTCIPATCVRYCVATWRYFQPGCNALIWSIRSN